MGAPFLTQIYPFSVIDKGVHTTIMGNPITFPFLTSVRQKEVMEVQSSSIFKQINCLQTKQNLIQHLQEEISYKHIEEKLQNPSIQTKISDLENFSKKRYALICPMLSGKEKSMSFHYLMNLVLRKETFQLKPDPLK